MQCVSFWELKALDEALNALQVISGFLSEVWVLQQLSDLNWPILVLLVDQTALVTFFGLPRWCSSDLPM